MEITVGRRVRMWRELLGVAQADLARRIGVTPSTVCDWESGRHSPKVERVVKALGLTMVQFYGEIRTPPARRAG